MLLARHRRSVRVGVSALACAVLGVGVLADARQLPNDSPVAGAPPGPIGIWAHYPGAVAIGAGIIAAEAVAIAALLTGRRRRRGEGMTARHDRDDTTRPFATTLPAVDRPAAADDDVAVPPRAVPVVAPPVDLEVMERLHELAHLNMVAALGELAASVAHELNQPLTAVLSNSQALRRMVDASAAGTEAHEVLDDIIDQTRRASEVTRRMRTLLKKEPFGWTPVDVNAIVEDVTRIISHEATGRGVTVATDLMPGLPAARGDRVQLRQVLLNLVLNAMQAASGVGGRASVVVATKACAEGLQITVTDSGPGIAAGAEGRVFEPFFTTRADGLGMGLSISRSIVELHGGRIQARNLPAGGAEFALLLPAEGAAV